ncbi:hypothetical protein OG782_02280 [Streptomyces sp. NBC_00876]|uniref:hypothetical protein n=1 Tax=Streptomyces sp. NBC_00876 TaxID=2975853 RepID=UPI00386F0575|nr:hypothetical protein OG782_02280 [Streptomyces sp. NBC_00876]
MSRREGVTESAPYGRGLSAQEAAEALASVDTATASPGNVAGSWWYGPVAALAVAAGVVVVGSQLTHAGRPGAVWTGALLIWAVALLLMRTRSHATGVRLPLSAHLRRGNLVNVALQLAAAGAAWALCALLGAGGAVTTAVVAVVTGLGVWARVVAYNRRTRRGLQGRA